MTTCPGSTSTRRRPGSQADRLRRRDALQVMQGLHDHLGLFRLDPRRGADVRDEDRGIHRLDSLVPNREEDRSCHGGRNVRRHTDHRQGPPSPPQLDSGEPKALSSATLVRRCGAGRVREVAYPAAYRGRRSHGEIGQRLPTTSPMAADTDCWQGSEHGERNQPRVRS